MAVSIEELDSLVRDFYEGRGEQVCILWISRILFLAISDAD
jgi:hypothetical protein